MNGNDVNVRFGGDTRSLDDATRKAKADIGSLQPAVTGLNSTLGKMKGEVTAAFTNPSVGKFGQEVKATAQLSRMQMMESIHVVRAFSDAVIAGQSPLRALFMESGRIAQISSQSAGGLRAVGSAIANMLGLVRTTTDAELAEEAASASAAATAVRGAVERSAAAITAADTEVALAEAAVRAAQGAEAEAAANARLAAALQAVSAASAEATIAQNAYAVAADRAAVASEASAAATVTKLTGRVYALGAVVTVALGALFVHSVMSFGRSMSESAEQTGRLAQKIGMSAAEVGQWSYVAKRAGLDTKDWSGAVLQLSQQQVLAANGGRRQKAVFDDLGISIKKTHTNSELMLQLAERFSKMPDGPKKTAEAMALMGQKGVDLIPVLNQGRKALEDQMNTAKQYGAVMDDKMVAAGQRVRDSLDNMHLATTGLKNELFSALAPAIQVTVEYFSGLVKEMTQSYKEGGFVKIMVDAIVVDFKVMVTVIMTVIEALKQLYHVAMAVLTPIVGTLSAVVEGIGDAITGNWAGAVSRFKDHMANVANNTVGHFKAMKDSAVDYGKTLGKLWTENGLGSPRARITGGGGGDLTIPGFGPKGPKGRTKHDHKELDAKIEEIEFEKDMARDNFDEQMRLEDEKLALLKKAYGEDSEQYKRALREKLRMKRDHDQEIVQLEKQKIELQRQIDEDGAQADHDVQQEILNQRKQAIEFDAQNGRISGQKKIQLLAQVTGEEQRLERESATRIFEIQKKAFEAELALQNLRPQERQRILDELAALEAKFAGDMRVLAARQATETANVSNQAAQSVIDKWKGIVSPIQDAFGQMFQTLYMRQASWKQAAISAADSIVMHWAQKGIEWLANWTAMQLAGKGVMAATKAAEVAIHTGAEVAKTGATVAGETARVAATATGAAASKSITIGSTLTEIGAKAANAAAGAYAAISSIPVVGPFLAPAVAAGILAAVLALGARVFSAEGGWGEVPHDGATTMLHKKEMVLPAKFAVPLRQMLSSGFGMPATGMAAGAGAAAGAAGRESLMDSSRGDVHLHHSPMYPTPPRDVNMEELLTREGDRLIRFYKRAKRDGKLD